LVAVVERSDSTD